MNTNSELLPDKFPCMTEDDFDNISRRFWREAEQERPEDRQLKFRLMWLGEWLQRTHNWSIQYHSCTPMQALHYAVIRRHHWLPAQVAELSLKEISLALTEEWVIFATMKDLKNRIEKRLDCLDSAFTFKAA